MNNAFTQNDLVQYIYGEKTPKENRTIGKLLATNWKMKESYDALNETVDFLDKEDLRSPSAASIDLILAYSRSTAPEEQKHYC